MIVTQDVADYIVQQFMDYDRIKLPDSDDFLMIDDYIAIYDYSGKDHMRYGTYKDLCTYQYPLVLDIDTFIGYDVTIKNFEMVDNCYTEDGVLYNMCHYYNVWYENVDDFNRWANANDHSDDELWLNFEKYDVMMFPDKAKYFSIEYNPSPDDEEYMVVYTAECDWTKMDITHILDKPHKNITPSQINGIIKYINMIQTRENEHNYSME